MTTRSHKCNKVGYERKQNEQWREKARIRCILHPQGFGFGPCVGVGVVGAAVVGAPVGFAVGVPVGDTPGVTVAVAVGVFGVAVAAGVTFGVTVAVEGDVAVEGSVAGVASPPEGTAALESSPLPYPFTPPDSPYPDVTSGTLGRTSLSVPYAP